MRHRRWSIALVCVGVVLLAGAVGFRLVAVPALVRFPLDIDETTHYTGTSRTYVDQATLLPLATPKVEPLSLSRHVKVVDGDFERAVIRETVTIKAGSTTSVEQYQYVMDRRSMKFLDDPRQLRLREAVGDHAARTGRLSNQLRSGHERRRHVPELHPRSGYLDTDSCSTRASITTPTRGIDVIDFTSTMEKPVAPYYRAHLEAMGLPMQVTAAQLQATALGRRHRRQRGAGRRAAAADPG